MNNKHPANYEYYAKKILLRNGGKPIPPKALRERIKHEMRQKTN